MKSKRIKVVYLTKHTATHIRFHSIQMPYHFVVYRFISACIPSACKGLIQMASSFPFCHFFSFFFWASQNCNAHYYIFISLWISLWLIHSFSVCFAVVRCNDSAITFHVISSQLSESFLFILRELICLFSISVGYRIYIYPPTWNCISLSLSLSLSLLLCSTIHTHLLFHSELTLTYDLYFLHFMA